MAIGQFYHATTDNQPLYEVYGGLQDNGSWGAPNRSRDGQGVQSHDWINIGGGDGFVCRVDRELKLEPGDELPDEVTSDHGHR